MKSMDSNYNHPQINIQVGNEITGDGDAYLKLNGNFSAQEAKTQMNQISQLSNELQADKSIIIVLTAASHDQAQLAKFIEETLNSKEGAFKEVAQAIKDQKIEIKVIQGNGKVLVQVKPGAEFEDMIWGSFQMVLDSGFIIRSDLCAEQENSFELLIKSKKGFQEIANEFKEMKQGLGANALEQVSAKLAFHLNKDLIDSVMGIIKNFDPELAQLPPLLLLSYFKSFSVDVKLSSPNELPEDFKKYFLTPQKYYNESEEQKELKEIPAEINKFMDLVGGVTEVYATLDNLAAFKLEVKGNYFSVLLKRFGGIFKC